MIRSELVEQSRLMMKEGSKSFAAASRLFDHATRERVWLLYAWCRRCDDLTDSQELGGTLGEQNDISAKDSHDKNSRRNLSYTTKPRPKNKMTLSVLRLSCSFHFKCID